MGSKWYADVHDIVKKSFFQLNLGGIVFPMTDILIYKYKKKKKKNLFCSLQDTNQIHCHISL